MCAKSLACSSTVPSVGASRPPNKCSSVLLPEPDAPTTATVSPRCTERSTPCSTWTSSGPSLKRLCRFSARITDSLIAQRLRRLHAACAPARVKRRHERKDERNRDDGDDVGAL